MKKWEELTLENFTGPLDLLVTMVRDKKIDIMKINLIELADQYLDYISSQQELDIEVASEYLAMSAQLIEMKSRLLLPKEVFEEDDDYSYDDFLEQLSTYDQIKSVTSFFIEKQEEYFKTYSKQKSRIKKISTIEEDLESYIDPTTLDMNEFASIFKSIMAKSIAGDGADDYDFYDEESFSTITTNVISPEEIATLITDKMSSDIDKSWNLEELLENNLLNIKNIISTFLAVLDLVRHQIAKITQIENNLFVKFSENGFENKNKLKEREGKENE